jgi:NADH-quinone oxidoreductase subunit N
MVIGNLVAISQSNIRRLFGYSTISHAGYILVGVAAGVKSGDGIFKAPEFAAIGPDSVLFYLAAYAAANLTAFFAITIISSKINSDQISDYAGLSTRNPVLAVVLALSLLALIGVPPTGIFIAKLYIFTAAVDSGLIWLAILGVINSAVSAYYYVRIIRVMFTQPSESDQKITASPAPWLALGLAGAAMVFMGIAPGFVMEAAQEAVKALAV